MNEKKEIFDNISQKLGYKENELEIDESILKLLSAEDLNDIDMMIDKKKQNARKDNLEFIENLYSRTKNDDVK